MAGFPLPRLRLNQPALRETVRGVVDAGTPGFVLALEAGITHYSKFSALDQRREIPASAVNIQRLSGSPTASAFRRRASSWTRADDPDRRQHRGGSRDD